MRSAPETFDGRDTSLTACPENATQDAQPSPSPVEVAYSNYSEAMASYREVERRFSRHSRRKREAERAMETADKLAQIANRACEATELELIRAIMEACPRELPGVGEWYGATAPLWMAVAGTTLFTLSRGRVLQDAPMNLEQVLESVSLAVVDLGSIGGAH